MDSSKYYVFNDDNCKFEGMSKEQIYAALAEMTGSTPGNVDGAFITKLKETNRGKNITIWRGTQAEYNALETIAEDCLYIITDDNTLPEICKSVLKAENAAKEAAKSAADASNLASGALPTVLTKDDYGDNLPTDFAKYPAGRIFFKKVTD